MYNLLFLSNIFAIILSEGLDGEETSNLATFLTSVADNLALIDINKS